MCIIQYNPREKAPASFWLRGIKIEAGKKIECSPDLAGLAKRDFPGIEVVSGDPVAPPPPATPTQLRTLRRAVELGQVPVHIALRLGG
jgi:hypothetical protein